MTRTVRLAQPEEASRVQEVYNHPQNGLYLGGFTLLEPIKSKIAARACAVVVEDGKIVAADETKRDLPHIRKLQLVGTDPEHKRTGAATLLYSFWALQSALEGRTQILDTIVGDNPVMPHFLSKLGFKKTTSQRSKVRRHHSLDLWAVNPLELIDKVPDENYELDFTEKFLENSITTVRLLDKAGRGEEAEQVARGVERVKERYQ